MPRPLAYLVAALLCLALVPAGAAAAAPPELLATPAATGVATRQATPGRAILRQRAVAPRIGVLAGADGSPRVAPGQRVGLTLFPDAAFTATITDVTRSVMGGRTWSGTLDGVDHGHVTLAVHDGALVGSVMLPRATYRIGYAADGTPVVEELDLSALPDEVEPIAPPAPATPPVPTAADGGAQIDVMVVFTAAARTAAGGAAAMLAEVNLAVGTANQAYANNGLAQRLRLVFAGEVPIVESGNFNTDLSALRSNTTVAWLRDVSRADLVTLLTSNGPSPPACGIAYLMTTASASFASLGFSVVDRLCAIGNLSYVHELGHNMGAHHDPFVTGTEASLFAYSHGYVDLVARVRTIMAYVDQCAATPPGTPCPRIPYFSSPAVAVAGRVIGTAAASDNSRTLAQTAATVAGFRQALVSPPTVVATVNQPAVAVGQTLVLGGVIDNPGRSGTADVYAGVLLPGGGIASFTNAADPASGVTDGSVGSPTSFRAIATGVALDSPLAVNVPGFFSYQRTGAEARGGYVFFILFVTAGALADGVLGSGELLGAGLASFSFP